MFKSIFAAFAVPSVLFLVAGCATDVAPEEASPIAPSADAPAADAAEDTAETAAGEGDATEDSLHLTGKKGGGGTVPSRPCLKCIGCSVSWGWNACCEVVEVACSSLPKAL